MSRYQMHFINDRRKPLVTNGPPLGIYGDTLEAAVSMSQHIWDKLAGEETARAYTLVDSQTGRACYTETSEV